MSLTHERIFNETYQYTAVLDREGTVIKVNDTACEAGRKDEGAFLGEKVWDLYLFEIFPDTRERLREDVRKAANGEFVRHDLTMQGIGGTVVLDFSIRPITDEGDTTLLAEGRDITQLVQQESIPEPAAAELDRSSFVISRSMGPDATVSTAVVETFLAADIDVNARETTLHDWVDPVVLDTFPLDDPSNRLMVRLWDHAVVVTGREIRIFADPPAE